MRAVVQRVTQAHVDVGERTVGRIGQGLLVLLGVEKGDSPADAEYIAAKLHGLRVFEDGGEGGPRHMNRSVADAGGAVLVVSQFTLCGDCRKGRRPSFDAAAPPDVARALYEDVVRRLREAGLTTETGEFRAMMQVHLVNDGPVTLLIDSRKQF
ncbi:MAG TPA: D-aminoacyl-tRNA deacylase [Vicinamibacterales bacterium]|nr:D-aminoacyl-tRNA deacylase [Vicinamibacterales bacterium]